MLNKSLVSILVCPETGGSLVLKAEQKELWCRASRLGYPIQDGIPVMLVERARPLTDEEVESL